MSRSRAVTSFPASKRDMESIVGGFTGVSPGMTAGHVSSLDSLADNLRSTPLEFIFGDGISDIAVGTQFFFPYASAGQITSWVLASPDTGTGTFGVLKRAKDTSMPVGGDSITPSGISINTATEGSRKNSDTPVGFSTTAVAVGDGVTFVCLACSGLKRIYMAVNIRRNVT